MSYKKTDKIVAVDERGLFCSESMVKMCIRNSELKKELLHCVRQYEDDDNYAGLLNKKKKVSTSAGAVEIWRENAGYVIAWA